MIATASDLARFRCWNQVCSPDGPPISIRCWASSILRSSVRNVTSRFLPALGVRSSWALAKPRQDPERLIVSAVSRMAPILPVLASSLAINLPAAVLTDSYKTSHYQQYPDVKKLVAYGSFRTGFNKDKDDSRLVMFGMRHLVETVLLRRWTEEEVEAADLFYRTHNAGFTQYPWPKEQILKFIRENDGYFPIKVEALPEGTCVHAQIPVYQITAEDEYAALCTWLETLLTMLWYPTTVCTSSRRCRDVIEAAFEQSVDGGKSSSLLHSRLHDFGFRGCTTVEQSVLGGCAHLVNFEGTDTLSAAYYAQFHLNEGRPVASSIPATEHSVMTAWPTEQMAIENMIHHFGSGVFACVMDSYDYANALSKVLPSIAEKKVGKGGFMVLRPDSGDPAEAVLMGLQAAEKVFGADVNSKGYKVLRGCGVIQGDGVEHASLKRIMQRVLAEGYSAQSVAFGMGGGLLQKVNRDTLSLATKLCKVVYADGEESDVMKMPTTDSGKISLPGVLAVKRVNGVPTVFPAESGEVSAEENLLQVVYNKGPVPGLKWPTFDEVRAQVQAEWDVLPKVAQVISPSLQSKVKAHVEQRRSHQAGLGGSGTF